MDYKSQMVKELSENIKKQGFRVFVAESGTYGFFTDENGSKVISFQVDPIVSFSGNYKTSNARQCGTGWRISEDIPRHFKTLFETSPPQWATIGNKWVYTTLEEHLGTYQKSSRYTEI